MYSMAVYVMHAEGPPRGTLAWGSLEIAITREITRDTKILRFFSRFESRVEQEEPMRHTGRRRP
jgi:hypothetical protein